MFVVASTGWDQGDKPATGGRFFSFNTSFKRLSE
jgi:hypothetical protein